MKKIVMLFCTCIFAGSMLAGCGSSSGSTTEQENPFEGKALADVVSEIYDKADGLEIQLQEPMELDQEMMQYSLGITDTTGIEEAVASEPFINVVPYSLCLVRVAQDADVEAIRQSIFQGADEHKWICVSAEKVTVNNAGNVIMLLMADTETTEKVAQAFADAADGVTGEALSRDETE